MIAETIVIPSTSVKKKKRQQSSRSTQEKKKSRPLNVLMEEMILRSKIKGENVNVLLEGEKPNREGKKECKAKNEKVMLEGIKKMKIRS